jgi:uncharacterized protein (DUF736 family)
MRKRIAALSSDQKESKFPEGWIDLEQIGTVEVTSEDPNFPVESVFGASKGPGWRAREKGEQQIRIIFDQPISVKRIHLKFIEAEVERTQEFTIRWASAQGGATKEVARQRWNFSPTGSSREVEDYEVCLDGVSALELGIRPDLGRGDALATLAEWRIA